ncbi:MAG TPA: hypothetical protein ENO19_00300 [Halothiobacillaceae bacterium]|nr:hypothetical protein [Halothiobacillaceae bacterium]
MRALILALIVVTATAARAQISPGELARAHQELEGMSNCLKCHDLGAGPSAEKCLTCHREIAAAVESGSGYHYRVVETEKRPCFECHSDHAGRSFDLVHWPDGREQFDHAQAGWPLSGAHAGLKCRECHRRSRLPEGFTRTHPDVNTERTFLGLDNACRSCHSDPHAGQFDRDCTACHGDVHWKPAARFDHARTAFPLRGRHAALECVRCHPVADFAGTTAVRYAGVAGDNCARCHNDPHAGRFGPDCASCHSEDAWKPVANFNHDRTAFPLTGKHRAVICAKCHPPANDGAVATYAGVAHDNCNSCHSDPHQGRLGPQCASCHTTAGWKQIAGKTSGDFDHGRTRYPLRGRHASVACERCHTGGTMTTPLEYDTCERCHRDVHDSQFAARATSPAGGACEQCHDVDGFVPARYRAADHARSRFPLTGAHLALPCIACHRDTPMPDGTTVRRFAFADLRCEACHEDPHAGQFASTAPAKTCDDCHGTAAWRELDFDHDRDSTYPLEGQHRRALCSGCHVPATISGETVTRYRTVARDCSACHTAQPAPLGGSS